MMFHPSRQRASVGMRWEESVLAMLDDLELQAEGLHLAERAVEVDELSVAQYAEVELVARLHASVGDVLRVSILDGLELHGRLAAAGIDWVMLDDGRAGGWVVHLPAVAVVGGLAPTSTPGEARPLSARLSLRSVLRGLADEARPCALHLLGGRALHGNLVRIGADFVELRQGEDGEPVTVPLSALAVVRGAS
jgi:hypothetical protein